MKIAEEQLGHGIVRGDAEILMSGMGVFVDNKIRNPVTGLYRLHFTELPH
jgi:hypothetical protein